MSESTNNIVLALRAIFLQIDLPYQSEPLPLGADTKNIKESDQKKEFIRLGYQDSNNLFKSFYQYGLRKKFYFLNGILVDKLERDFSTEELMQLDYYFDKEELLESFKKLEKKLLDPSFAKQEFLCGVSNLHLQLVAFILHRTKDIKDLYEEWVIIKLMKKLLFVQSDDTERDNFNMIAILVRAGFFSDPILQTNLFKTINYNKEGLKEIEKSPIAEGSVEYNHYIEIKSRVRKLNAAEDLIKSLLKPTAIPVAPPAPNPFGQSSETRTKPQPQPSHDRGDIKGTRNAVAACNVSSTDESGAVSDNKIASDNDTTQKSGTLSETSTTIDTDTMQNSTIARASVTVLDASINNNSGTAHQGDKKPAADQTKDTDKGLTGDDKHRPTTRQ